MTKKILAQGADASRYALDGQAPYPETHLRPAHFDVLYARIFHPEDGRVPFWKTPGKPYADYSTAPLPSVTEQIERQKAAFGLSNQTHVVLERKGKFDDADSDGLFALPFPQDLFGISHPFSIANYGSLTERVVTALAAACPLLNKRSGELANRVQLTVETRGHWNRYAQMLPASPGTIRFLVAPGSMGRRFKGYGATIARAEAKTNGWMVPGPAEVGTILIAWPERMTSVICLEHDAGNALDCVGAVYDTKRSPVRPRDARSFGGSLFYTNPDAGEDVRIRFQTCFNASNCSPSAGLGAAVLFT